MLCDYNMTDTIPHRLHRCSLASIPVPVPLCVHRYSCASVHLYSLLVRYRTYLGKIMLGMTQDPFPRFGAFSVGFFGRGWDTGSCDVLTGMTLGWDSGLCDVPTGTTSGWDTRSCNVPTGTTSGWDMRSCNVPTGTTSGWDTGSCNVSSGRMSLGTSHCLQTLDKNETVSTNKSEDEMTRNMRIDSLHDMSNFSIKKALVDIAIADKVFQKLN